MRRGAWPILLASLSTIRRDGPVSFAKKTLEKVRKGEWAVYTEAESSDTALMARAFDFTQQDTESSNAVQAANPSRLDLKEVNWFVPTFENAYWGGIHTILRFAEYFRTRKLVKNRIIVVGPERKEEVQKKLLPAFPNVADEVITITTYPELDTIPAADAAVCSQWTTAYFTLRFNRTKRKFYFIQDFEPLFYPAGSTFAQAEATYRFGFHGIANTQTLADAYRRYGGIVEFFTPCVDTELFHPAKSVKQGPFTLFFYGRPGHPRNCFELGAEALKRVKKNLGNQIRIVSAGAEWKPEEYGLDGIVEPLGLLSYEETANLYRTCDAGISLTATMHPSYIPLQLMASGSLVISNRNLNSDWLLKDHVNCILCDSSASSISNAVTEAYHNQDLREKLTRNAHETITRHYSDWEGQMRKIYQFMTNLHATNPASP